MGPFNSTTRLPQPPSYLTHYNHPIFIPIYRSLPQPTQTSISFLPHVQSITSITFNSVSNPCTSTQVRVSTAYPPVYCCPLHPKRCSLFIHPFHCPSTSSLCHKLYPTPVPPNKPTYLTHLCHNPTHLQIIHTVHTSLIQTNN